MAIKLTHSESQQTYFCTFTCLDWMKLFEITNLYDEIYKWLNILINNQYQIAGFVIMPNHIHLLIHVTHSKSTINTILANGKRFFAYEIVSRLEGSGRMDILTILSNRVTVDEKKRKKKHRVFEVSSDIKPCYTEKFLVQKLEYIHLNPVSGEWQLSELPEKYPHSSAAFYELNEEHSKIKITHYKELGDPGSPMRIVPETGDDT